MEAQVIEKIRNDDSNGSPFYHKILISEEMNSEGTEFIRTFDLKEIDAFEIMPRIMANFQYKIMIGTITKEEFTKYQQLTGAKQPAFNAQNE